MSDIVGTFRSYAHDKDNMPRMETEIVYVRVKHLLEAAAEIERLRAALHDVLGWHDYSNDMHKPIEVRAAYMRARAALEDKP